MAHYTRDDDDDDVPLALKRGSVASNDLLQRPTYEARTSTNSIEPFHQQRHSKSQSASSLPRSSIGSLPPSASFLQERSSFRDVEGGRRASTYGDFNNTVRMSSADLYSNLDGNSSGQSYGVESKLLGDEKSAYRLSSYELPKDASYVPAPKRGSDWRAGEVLADQEREKRLKRLKPAKDCMAWIRGDRKCCGGLLTWRTFVFLTFGFVIGLGVMLYFLIPRQPSFAFNTQTPLNATGADAWFTHIPGNFTFSGQLSLAVDSTSNWIPIHFTSLLASVNNVDTDHVIGTGDMSGLSVPGRKLHPISFPVKFAYASPNFTDITWSQVFNACQHEWPGNSTRPNLNLGVTLSYSIRGMIGSKTTGTHLTPFACPFQLPGNVQ